MPHLQALLDGLLELLAPTRCAGCDLPGTLLCDVCLEQIAFIDPAGACSRCGAPYGWLVCTECWEREWSFAAARCAGELEAPLSRLVTLFKDGGERRLASMLATLVATTAAEWRSWADVVTYVPATDAAHARRGFDHARLVAHDVAAAWNVPCADTLERRRARDQRTLGRIDRFTNAERTFVVRAAVQGRVVLVDDVFTTGATVHAAARALADAGAAEVRVAAVARAW